MLALAALCFCVPCIRSSFSSSGLDHAGHISPSGPGKARAGGDMSSSLPPDRPHADNSELDSFDTFDSSEFVRLPEVAHDAMMDSDKPNHPRSFTEHCAVEVFLRRPTELRDGTGLGKHSFETASLTRNLGERYGVTSRAIRHVWIRRSWAWATRPHWTPHEHQEELQETLCKTCRARGVTSLEEAFASCAACAAQEDAIAKSHRPRGRPVGAKDSHQRNRRSVKDEAGGHAGLAGMMDASFKAPALQSELPPPKPWLATTGAKSVVIPVPERCANVVSRFLHLQPWRQVLCCMSDQARADWLSELCRILPPANGRRFSKRPFLRCFPCIGGVKIDLYRVYHEVRKWLAGSASSMQSLKASPMQSLKASEGRMHT